MQKHQLIELSWFSYYGVYFVLVTQIIELGSMVSWKVHLIFGKPPTGQYLNQSTWSKFSYTSQGWTYRHTNTAPYNHLFVCIPGLVMTESYLCTPLLQMLSLGIQDWKDQKNYLKIWNGSRSKAMSFRSHLLLEFLMLVILKTYLRRILKHFSATSIMYTLRILQEAEWLVKRYENKDAYLDQWVFELYIFLCEDHLLDHPINYHRPHFFVYIPFLCISLTWKNEFFSRQGSVHFELGTISTSKAIRWHSCICWLDFLSFDVFALAISIRKK